jgi:hypothetical protein
MAVKIDTLETVPPHVAVAAGLGGKAIRSRLDRDVVTSSYVRTQTSESIRRPQTVKRAPE